MYDASALDASYCPIDARVRPASHAYSAPWNPQPTGRDAAGVGKSVGSTIGGALGSLLSLGLGTVIGAAAGGIAGGALDASDRGGSEGALASDKWPKDAKTLTPVIVKEDQIAQFREEVKHSDGHAVAAVNPHDPSNFTGVAFLYNNRTRHRFGLELIALPPKAGSKDSKWDPKWGTVMDRNLKGPYPQTSWMHIESPPGRPICLCLINNYAHAKGAGFGKDPQKVRAYLAWKELSALQKIKGQPFYLAFLGHNSGKLLEHLQELYTTGASKHVSVLLGDGGLLHPANGTAWKSTGGATKKQSEAIAALLKKVSTGAKIVVTYYQSQPSLRSKPASEVAKVSKQAVRAVLEAIVALCGRKGPPQSYGITSKTTLDQAFKMLGDIHGANVKPGGHFDPASLPAALHNWWPVAVQTVASSSKHDKKKKGKNAPATTKSPTVMAHVSFPKGGSPTIDGLAVLGTLFAQHADGIVTIGQSSTGAGIPLVAIEKSGTTILRAEYANGLADSLIRTSKPVRFHDASELQAFVFYTPHVGASALTGPASQVTSAAFAAMLAFRPLTDFAIAKIRELVPGFASADALIQRLAQIGPAALLGIPMPGAPMLPNSTSMQARGFDAGDLSDYLPDFSPPKPTGAELAPWSPSPGVDATIGSDKIDPNAETNWDYSGAPIGRSNVGVQGYGATTRADWNAALGDPDSSSTLNFGDESAYGGDAFGDATNDDGGGDSGDNPDTTSEDDGSIWTGVTDPNWVNPDPNGYGDQPLPGDDPNWNNVLPEDDSNDPGNPSSPNSPFNPSSPTNPNPQPSPGNPSLGLPAGSYAQVCTMLGTWNRKYPGNCQPSDFGSTSSDISTTETGRSRSALASFQGWYNRTQSGALRTDGGLDQPTYDALVRVTGGALMNSTSSGSGTVLLAGGLLAAFAAFPKGFSGG
jgi:hypothetical protein